MSTHLKTTLELFRIRDPKFFINLSKFYTYCCISHPGRALSLTLRRFKIWNWHFFMTLTQKWHLSTDIFLSPFITQVSNVSSDLPNINIGSCQHYVNQFLTGNSSYPPHYEFCTENTWAFSLGLCCTWYSSAPVWVGMICRYGWLYVWLKQTSFLHI